MKHVPCQTRFVTDRSGTSEFSNSFVKVYHLDSDLVEIFHRGNTDIAIQITNGSFSWDVLSGDLVLKNINIKVTHGIKVVVCDQGGSRKSSLLSCIPEEMPKLSGSVKLRGNKAFLAQSPWIHSGKIEENILFDKDMDRIRYDKVLEACALKKDLEILHFGDQTVISDAHTESHLYKECLLELLNSKHSYLCQPSSEVLGDCLSCLGFKSWGDQTSWKV